MIIPIPSHKHDSSVPAPLYHELGRVQDRYGNRRQSTVSDNRMPRREGLLFCLDWSQAWGQKTLREGFLLKVKFELSLEGRIRITPILGMACGAKHLLFLLDRTDC